MRNKRPFFIQFHFGSHLQVHLLEMLQNQLGVKALHQGGYKIPLNEKNRPCFLKTQCFVQTQLFMMFKQDPQVPYFSAPT
jgi:hypothetical protein